MEPVSATVIALAAVAGVVVTLALTVREAEIRRRQARIDAHRASQAQAVGDVEALRDQLAQSPPSPTGGDPADKSDLVEEYQQFAQNHPELATRAIRSIILSGATEPAHPGPLMEREPASTS